MSEHSFEVSDAIAYGVEEAIILKNIRFWLTKNAANGRHSHDGYYWTYNAVRAFSILFPYWSSNKIQKLLKKMEDSGLIISGNYNETAYDRTKWYTLPEFAIPAISGSADTIQPNGLMEAAKRLNRKSEMAEPIPDSKPDTKQDNKPDNPIGVADAPCTPDLLDDPVVASEAEPDRADLFAKFWKLYPNRKGKAKAEAAWRKLKLTDILVNQIFEGLARYCASPDWTKDGGQFIPHPATWLNGRRWEDEIQVTAPSAPGRHTGFDKRDYTAGLIDRGDGTYGF